MTNAGTSEHVVGPTRDFRDQWQVFATMHDALDARGALMHVIPDELGEHGGCGYVYTHRFLPALAERCRYSITEFYDSRTDVHHMAALLLKTPSSRFPDFDEFVAMGEILRT